MIRNLTKLTCVAAAPVYARRFSMRLRGMIGRDFDGFDAMVFQRCNSVHTFFMRRKIDILFLDEHNTVVKVCADSAPYHLFAAHSARTVLELPPGHAAHTQTDVGDKLDIGAECTHECCSKKRSKISNITQSCTPYQPKNEDSV